MANTVNATTIHANVLMGKFVLVMGFANVATVNAKPVGRTTSAQCAFRECIPKRFIRKYDSFMATMKMWLTSLD